MDPVEHNRAAWNRLAREGIRWSQPVGPEVIAAARAGRWEVILTPNKPVPRAWFGELAGKDVLCLASGGGQQAPVLAAAGGRVTSFDNSDEQLALDRLVANREGLELRTVRGDMRDLSVLPDDSFDLIFHPVSNVFCPDLAPVWRECHRVLRPGGSLLAGFMNPAAFLFDGEEVKRTGELKVRYALPYSDLADLPAERRERVVENGEPFEYGHTLDDQIGGQLRAGLVLADLFEDDWSDEATPLNPFMKVFLATRAVKRKAG